MAESKQEKVARIMRLLDCTENEALDVIKNDEIIDKGGRTEFDFDKEKEKMAKKFANVETHKKTAYKFTKRERKENATKKGIIDDLFRFLTENANFIAENVEITNKERQIKFNSADETFELTLVQKRKPKK